MVARKRGLVAGKLISTTCSQFPNLPSPPSQTFFKYRTKCNLIVSQVPKCGDTYKGAAVAHWQQHKIERLQSWVRIQQSPQPTVDCQSSDGLPSGMALRISLSSEGWQRKI
jgi:hypothetical protein